MNKELLETINSMIERIALIELHTGETKSVSIDKHTLLDIQKELELQLINNSKLSEALERLSALCNYQITNKNKDNYEYIKQALLKVQEQEKVLEIIRRKGLPLIERDMIILSENYEQYCIKYDKYNMMIASIQKTEEEFDLLKRCYK